MYIIFSLCPAFFERRAISPPEKAFFPR